MSATTYPQVEEKEFVIYCGQEVILIDIESTPYGNSALIQFEDGREDSVPLSTINFLK